MWASLDEIWLLAWVGLWAAWLVQATLAMLKVRKFAQQLGKTSRASGAPRRRAWVILPAKGLSDDPGTAVRRLCEQDYPDYRLLFVVESRDDPAFSVLQRLIADSPRPARLIVAGTSPPDQGQKTHNQLCVLRQIEPQSDDEDVWVFADSDAAADPQWLNHLLDPLQPKRGYRVSSGYRWLVPVPTRAAKGDSQAPAPAPARVRVWSCLASVINGSVACLLGRKSWDQAWGGSMAVRVGFARQGDLIGRLTGALTDDYPLTRLAHDHGEPVYFVNQCLLPSPVDFRFADLMNFGHRQYLITRVYAPKLYAGAAFLVGLYVLSWWSALVAAGFWWWSGSPGWAVGALAVWLAVNVLDVVRAGYRRQVVLRAFDATTQQALQPALGWDRWGTIVCMMVHGLLILRAGLGRRMLWRGIRYRLDGSQRVQRLN